MKLPKLSADEQKQFENGVIQVNGKAMNRTALGIIAAYFKLYPKTTFAELKEAFPDSINPSGPRAPKSIFKPYSDRDFGVVHNLAQIKKEFADANLPYEGLFFLEKDEMFKTSDGVTVVVNRLWESKDTETGESDLENLAKVALKYGIVVNKFEARSAFSRGSYSLDILAPAVFDKIIGNVKIIERERIVEKEVEKKVIPFWVWIVLGLGILFFLLWLLGVFNPKQEVVEKEVVKQVEVVKTDTVKVYANILEDIEKQFNAVQFEVDKYDLPEDAKFPLYDLAKLLKQNPNLVISIEGHTSKEGDVNHNQKLSENRAKSAVDFLISQDVPEEQVQYKGLGSSQPIDEDNLEVNRRTEFVIVNQ